MIDILTIIFSGIAILVSIGMTIWVHVKTEKREKHNLENEFYKEVFFEYLVRKIPEQRKFVGFTREGRFWESYTKFNNLLTDMRKDILYFSYRNHEFYDKLNNELLELDEMLVKQSKVRNANYREKEKFQKEFDKRIEEIYEYIMDNYLG